MGFFGGKPEKRKGAKKFKTLSVSLSPSKPKPKSPASQAKAPRRKMGFDEWLEHYAAMSNGNPV